MDHSCPGCTVPIPSRQVAGQSRRVPYRSCPSCEARIVHDPDTKRRQVVALVIGVATLATLPLATWVADGWWVATVVLSVVLGLWIAYGERRVQWVLWSSGERLE